MAKKKQHNAFWKDIKFKYKLTLTDENSLEEVGSVYFIRQPLAPISMNPLQRS